MTDRDALRAALEVHEQNLVALGRTMVQPRPENWEPLLGERIAAVVNGLAAIRAVAAALAGSGPARVQWQDDCRCWHDCPNPKGRYPTRLAESGPAAGALRVALANYDDDPSDIATQGVIGTARALAGSGPALTDREFSLRARAAERAFDEEMHLRRFVGRVASMGGCSQTHHEHLAREAAALGVASPTATGEDGS